jgi:DNA-binding LacI/PurR family transcriptional regulator
MAITAMNNEKGATRPLSPRFAYTLDMMRNMELRNSDNTALYKVVERHLCSAIAEGKLSPGERLQSPEKLAKSWGLSAGTLRQALQILAARGVVIRRPKLGTFVNPNFNPSSGATDRERITSQATSLERRNCLAMVVPDLLKYDYAAVMRGVESAAEASKMSIIIGNSEDNPARLNQVVRQQLNERVAGLIIASGRQMSLDFDLVREIQESRVPVVACYRPIGLVEWPVIRSDGEYNTQLLVRHLCEIGRKHIAYFDFATDSDTELDFKRDGRLGFLSALADAGVMPDSDLHLEVPYSTYPQDRSYYVISDQDIDPVATWLKERPQVDAIICVSDRLATQVVRALKKIGRSVPQDVAVCGFGHHGRLFGLGEEWLTSVEVKFSDIGRQACDMILDMRGGKTILPNTTVSIKGTLAIGTSTVAG